MPTPEERTAAALERIASALEALVTHETATPSARSVRRLLDLVESVEAEDRRQHLPQRPRVVR